MKLYYRGLAYEYQPNQQPQQPFQPVSRSGQSHNLKYRGVTYHVDPNTQSTEVALLPTAYKLIYRGITYFINKTAKKANFSSFDSAILDR